MSVSIQSSAFSTPTNVTVNGANQGQIPANFPIDVNLTDGTNNIAPTSTTLVGNTLTLEAPEIWWKRPSGWLPMPTITAADNKFAGLYAVFEDDPLDNTITIDIIAGLSIDWGDGTIITSVSGVNTHNYDYATISGVVLVSDDGRNYKMVMVEVDLTGASSLGLENSPIAKVRTTGWLDILAAGSNLQIIHISGNLSTNIGLAIYLERFRVLNMSATAVDASRAFQNLTRLKVIDYPLLTNATGFNSIFSGTSDVRDSNGQPLNITGVSGFDFRNFNVPSGVTKFGDILFPTCTLASSVFINAPVTHIGNMDFSSLPNMSAFFQSSQIQQVGTITVSTALTNIFRVAISAHSLQSLIFSGDMSGVTNTNQAFNNCFNMERLILPNITVGFDIRASQITGTNLQDLFTSLGTASGAQTITLPTFTTGEDTSIATGKGYTIAYA